MVVCADQFAPICLCVTSVAGSNFLFILLFFLDDLILLLYDTEFVAVCLTGGLF